MNYVNNILTETTNKLLIYSTSASLDAEVLLSHILKKDKAWLLANPNFKLNLWQTIKYNYLIAKRIKHYPIAYLIGQQEFYGLNFKVNKYTLVPRPESELFIDELIKIDPVKKTIVDIGTGSGCLIISLAKYLPNNTFLGIDISKQALRIARTNAQDHKTNIRFIQNNLLDGLNTKMDIIVANLPYLNLKQMNEPSIQKEPASALIAKDNGLYYYKKLLHQISILSYKPEYILLEIDPRQAKLIKEHISSTLPEYNIEIAKDLSANDRLVILNNKHLTN